MSGAVDASPAVEIAPAPVPPEVPIAAAAVSRTCTICGEQFTPAAPAFRALRCSPACRREFKHRYQQERRASDEGFRERARLEQAARRRACKACKISAVAALQADPVIAAYWWTHHRVRLCEPAPP